MAFRGNSTYGYGDMTFNSSVSDAGLFLGNLKEDILESHYKDQAGIDIVITALNKI